MNLVDSDDAAHERGDALPSFVGRAAELARLESFFAVEGRSRLAHVRGPGGIGKSTLLHELGARLAARGIALAQVDARDLPFSRHEIRLVLEHALAMAAAPAGSAPRARRLLVVDTGEERSIVELVIAELLAERGADAPCVLIGSRSAPSRELRDVVLRGVATDLLALGPLTAAESVDYLRRRGFAEARAKDLARLASGHPLALALCADAERSGHAPTHALDESPHILDELCSVFVRDVPSAAHRSALQICCSLRWTTEEPLLALLGDAGPACFAWLRRLSFVEATPFGLAAHEIAREAILADLRWRSPESFPALLHRCFLYVAERMTRRPGIAPEDFAQILALLGVLPAMRPYSHLPADFDDSLDPAGPSDLPAMQALVARHEGPEAAALVSCWFAAQPGAFAVVRARDGRVVGFGAVLRLDQADAATLERDPATRAAMAYAASQRSRGPIAYVRWLMVDAGPFAQTPQMTLCITLSGAPMFQLPELDFAFLAVPARDVWPLPLQVEVPEASFTLDGRTFHVLMHDRRGVAPSLWASRFLDAAVHYGRPSTALLTTRDAPGPSPQPGIGVAAIAGTALETMEREPIAAAGVTLEPDELQRAVGRAFRAFGDDRRLAHNPLLFSTLIAGTLPKDAPTPTRLASLRELLSDATARLGAQGAKGARLARVLDVAYLRPAETQQTAADALKMSYGTFRRLVHQALDRAVDDLASRQIEAARRAPSR